VYESNKTEIPTVSNSVSMHPQVQDPQSPAKLEEESLNKINFRGGSAGPPSRRKNDEKYDSARPKQDEWSPLKN